MSVTSSTIDVIREEWNLWGISSIKVSNSEIFYSGQISHSKSEGPEVFLNRKSLWMSQSAFWAAEYCYWGGEKKPSDRYLLKLGVLKEISLVRFPENLHPADVFKVNPKDNRSLVWREDMTTEQMQPDHFISKYWDQIVTGTPFEHCVGHLRYATEKDIESLGAQPGCVLEAWVADASLLRLLKWIKMPGSKDLYKEKYCTNMDRVGSSIFDLGDH